MSGLRAKGIGAQNRPTLANLMRREDSLEQQANRVDFVDNNEDAPDSSNGVPLTAILALAYQSIGVVYGDLGTSPLYVFSSVFPSREPSKDDILGVLSIIIYTVTLISLIKYVFIALQVNDNGNGGTFALYSLICRHARIPVAQNQIQEDQNLSSFKIRVRSSTLKRRAPIPIKDFLRTSTYAKNILLTTAIMGTAMVIGDGILTPAISDVVVGVTCAILVGLFSMQSFGTEKVAHFFSPVLMLWFVSIGAIGVYNIAKHGTSVFLAFNPYHVLTFFSQNKVKAWISLGGIVLCITGTEAMFADVGHFSPIAIQVAFSFLVYPCLLCAYLGQAAYLMRHPENVRQTFYRSIPGKLYWPMFSVATCSAIIASQAMISATFSIVYQAANLGCFPRVKMVHTSGKFSGQIYIPEMNWTLMLLCVLIAALFRDTSQIGNAYGVAVTADMVITTHLLTLVMIMIWRTPLFLSLIFYFCLTAVELTYLSSVLFKLRQGGWLPVVFVVVISGVMFSWQYGRSLQYQCEVRNQMPMEKIVSLGSDLGMSRVPGVGLVFSELAQGVPIIFSHLTSKVPAMHSVVAFVCVKHLPVAHVPDGERLLLRRVGPMKFRLYRCAVRYGYNDLRVHDDEYDGTFENLLMQALVEFLQTEHNVNEMDANDLEMSKIRPNQQLGQHLHQQLSPIMEVEERSEGTPRQSVTSSHPRPSVARDGWLELQEELEVLDAAMRSRIVYLTGHTDVRARKDSPWLKKVLIDYVFRTLKYNCRSSIVSLPIPRANLLSLGMIHEI